MLTSCRGGAQIFKKGDEADTVFAVIQGPGRVRIGSAGDSGKTLMVEVFGVGEIFSTEIDSRPRFRHDIARLMAVAMLA